MMDFLRQWWPTPFKIKKANLVSFIVQLLIFVLICAVIGWLMGILGKIAIVGFIFRIIGWFMEIYGFVGIILCIGKFLGIIE